MADSNYMKALKDYNTALRTALSLSDNPFQAPEVVVEDSRNLLSAIWNVQVEYAAMMKK